MSRIKRRIRMLLRRKRWRRKRSRRREKVEAAWPLLRVSVIFAPVTS